MMPYSPRYPGAYEPQQQFLAQQQQQFIMQQMMATSQVRYRVLELLCWG